MVLIAGPCVIEDKNTLETVVETILETLPSDVDFFFKSSCVKDNRTSSQNYSGVGMYEGIKLLQDIRSKYRVKITTDFHNVSDIQEFGKIVDLIQIPAYLAQQTSISQAAIDTTNKIHIKKPQFLGPLEANILIKKFVSMGAKLEDLIITDRGTMFGYDKYMMDPRHFLLMKESGVKVLSDITHPNKNYPGYTEELIKILGRSAMVSGADGIFMEMHPNCSKAKCDSLTMFDSNHFSSFFKELYTLYNTI